MNELQKALDEVYRLLEGIPVTGGAVELMAGAKQGLRNCFQLAADKPESPDEREGGDK